MCCVTGPDGSGKSTLIASLSARLMAESGLRAREVSVWDLMKQPDIRASFPVDPRRIDEYLSRLCPASRSHFLLHCLSEAMARAAPAPADLLLINGHWYKYLACEIAHGAPEPELIAMTAGLPEPELVLYLDVPVEVAIARKQRFSGYESGFAAARDAAAFAAFQGRVRPVLSRWCAERGWTRIDGTLEPGAVLEAAWRSVQGLIRGSEERV